MAAIDDLDMAILDSVFLMPGATGAMVWVDGARYGSKSKVYRRIAALDVAGYIVRRQSAPWGECEWGNQCPRERHSHLWLSSKGYQLRNEGGDRG